MKSEHNNPNMSRSITRKGAKDVIFTSAKPEKGKEASGKGKKLPEHDSLAQNLVLGEDSGPMLTTSEMLDFSQGADS